MDDMQSMVVRHDQVLTQHSTDISELKTLTQESLQAFNGVAQKLERLLTKFEDAHTPANCPLSERINTLSDKFTNATNEKNSLQDRITKLENYRWYLAGAIALIGVLSGVIIPLINLLHK